MAQARKGMVAGAGRKVVEEVAVMGQNMVKADRCFKAVTVQLMAEGVAGATTEVEGVELAMGEEEDLDMLVAVRTLEVPRCCKAPRGPAQVQCCPRRPLSLAM